MRGQSIKETRAWGLAQICPHTRVELESEREVLCPLSVVFAGPFGRGSVEKISTQEKKIDLKCTTLMPLARWQRTWQEPARRPHDHERTVSES